MSPASQRSLKSLAEAISLVLHPLIITIVGLMGVVWIFAPSNEQFWKWTGIAMFLLFIPSGAWAVWGWYQKRSVDIDISRREDRIIPLLLVCLGSLIGGFLVAQRLENTDFFPITMAVSTVLVTITIVTVFWKISLHAASVAGFVTLLVVYGGPLYAWGYLLLPVVSWARVYLKEHTLAQVVGGTLVGTVVTGVCLVAFRA